MGIIGESREGWVTIKEEIKEFFFDLKEYTCRILSFKRFYRERFYI